MRINAKAGTGCGHCHKQKGDSRFFEEVDRARRTLAGLDAEAKKRFKATLGVSEVVVFVQGAKGIENRTF